MGSKKVEGGEVSLAEFIDIKGWKALGNRLSDQKLLDIREVIEKETPSVKTPPATPEQPVEPKKEGDLKAGDTIEFDFG